MSGLGIVFKSLLRTRGIEPDAKSYCARLYYSRIGTHSWEVNFVITLDLEVHQNVSNLQLFVV